MTIKVALTHRTRYTFDRPVKVFPHVVRLRPAPHSRTPIEAYTLDVSPAEHFINWQQDPFGNYLARLVFPEPTTELEFTVGLVADLQVINPFDFFVEEYAETFPFSYPRELAGDLKPYLAPVEDAEGAGLDPSVTAWIDSLPPVPENGSRIVDFLVQLNAAVHAEVAYSIRMEAGVQTPAETLQRRIGSCRDSAWLLVAVLRHYGLAARFVSGYLVQLASDQKSLDGPNGPEADFTDLHAWTEVYIPGAGWIGLDPTSALFAGEGHIPLAATPHPVGAAPITGATGPCQVSLEFENVVTRFHEDPRVTKPYTDAQVAQLNRLGEQVDARLRDQELTLTMGGEPTFVSIDDFESPQWTVAADGADKRRLANRLTQALQSEFAKGGLLQRGQGKWYPGEPLPRWQFALHWREDAVPLWANPEVLADPTDHTRSDPQAPLRAEQLARAMVAALGLPPSQAHPCYEDPLLALAAEYAAPEGEAVAEQSHPGPALVTDLDAGSGGPVAWAVPLSPDNPDAGTRAEGSPDTSIPWVSATWRTRRGRIVLIPGDSPAGLRLPLASIAWTPPDVPVQESYVHAGPPLSSDPAALRAVTMPAERVLAPTALVVQARDGFVHVFLPPLERLDDLVALLALLETVASQQARQHGGGIVVEGYGPPPDPRLRTLMVTPDPGVIEVNVQPTSSWSELRDLTHTLYRVARENRLGTETFGLDGRHSGTGGGNHLTLGGPTPDASPMLRRPDLLVSMLTYWQRHPSLSYLFSGRFIGPTSQAPRVDEGRPETLYELEIAFAQIEALAADDTRRLWAVDRALRHLLTDVTGNTHRAEFCIDKLYSPDGPRGRLGLVELRGFEMPPHPDMALVQALLVRALLVRFAEDPYSAPLIRWGTRLHERYLLPHFVAADLAHVVADLRAHDLDVDLAWFDPYLEFRFPRYGTTSVEGVDLELRAAIEPWHVLGEEATGSGTARYVDSSVERLQVRTTGLQPDRHLVLCNGRPVPMTSTGTPGEQVAGVRYKAWQPPSGLHPMLPVDAPLTFEVIDRANRMSLGGATYHVHHPGGRSYDTFPVNPMEAESRRTRRFEPMGHTVGRVDIDALAARQAWHSVGEQDYPLTLDLRHTIPRRWGRS
ncbi:MAG: DUF2126 domain-containing protein [Actinomycetales bacterium]